MNKAEAKSKLKGSLIAVIRVKDFEFAKSVCSTILKSGINAIEVTFSVADADKLIKYLKVNFPNAVIGAGTVLNVEQAQKALDSGADYIVSPCIIEEVGKFCTEHNVFCSMGAATATEAFNSYKAGSDVVKLFPGEFLKPGIIKSFKAPLPFLDFMPTGGINDKNVKEWFDAGAFAAGIGGYLTKGVDENNLELISERCRLLTDAIK